MPKIRDLGINVIPEITRPPEVGPGGGCHCTMHTRHDCAATVPCSPNYGCRATPIDCGGGTLAQTAGCGNMGPTDKCSIYCPGQYYGVPCDVTQNPPCGATDRGEYYGCNVTQNPPCGATDRGQYRCGGATLQNSPGCQLYEGANCGATVREYACGGPTNQLSANCYPRVLTREAIAQLKQQLYKQIEQLDEYAKSIGPKTAEEIDAREKELNAELEELAKRRQDLGK